MPVTGLQATVALAVAREALNNAFEALWLIGQKGNLPCTAIALYEALRQKHMARENALIAELKQRGQHPPEDAPRSLAVMGACPPGVVEAPLSKNAVAGGKKYLDDVKKRQATYADAFKKAIASDSSLTTYVNQSAGETGGNVPGEYLFTLGGTAWPIDAARAGHGGQLNSVTGGDLQVGVVDSLQLLQTLSQMAENRGARIESATTAKKGSSWFWPILGSLAAVAVGGGVWYFVKQRSSSLSDGDESVDEMFDSDEDDEEELDDGDGDEHGSEDRPRLGRPRSRSRGGLRGDAGRLEAEPSS